MSTQLRLLNPYLNFPGNTEEAFNFYSSVLEGKIVTMQKFKDTPHGSQISEADSQKIMHAALRLKDGTTLMGSDNIGASGVAYAAGNNFSLSLHPESEQEAEKLFNRLSEGGKVTMPLQKTFWNAYFGMFTDKYGIQWMINHEYPEENK